MNHPADPVVGYKDTSSLSRFLLQLIEQIVDSLRDMEHGFSPIKTSRTVGNCVKKLPCPSGRGFKFPEILFNKAWLFLRRNTCDL